VAVGASYPIIAGSNALVNRKNGLWKNKFDRARHGTKREQKFWRPQGILTGFRALVKRKNAAGQKKSRQVKLAGSCVLLGE
jgi:hypothetical protein